jgi:hypothetical protein
MIWDLNLAAFFSSQAFSSFTRGRDRQSATNTPSYRCCPGLLSFAFLFNRQLRFSTGTSL